MIQQWIQSGRSEAPLLIIAERHFEWDAFVQTATTHIQEHDILHVAEGEPSITIAHIRALRKQLHNTPWGEKHLVVIRDAERLNREAANALLKELEESTPRTRFLLTTSYMRRILPTITSRCQIVRLHASTARKSSGGISLKEVITSSSPELSEEDLSVIETTLQERVQTQGPSPHVFRCFLRLRDYYKIRSKKGNTKLAADILKATLHQLT